MTDKLNREEVVRRLTGLIRAYGARCAETKNLAPSSELVDALNNLLSARQEQAEPIAQVCGAMGGIKWLVPYRPEFEDRALYFLQHQEPIKASADERKAFENWHSGGFPVPSHAFERTGETYKYMATQQLWNAWEARAALSIAQPANNYHDAYRGAREEMEIWKKRALAAEKALRLPAALNNPVEVEFVKKEAITNIIKALAELLDRVLPEEYGNSILVIADELRDILEDTLVPVTQPVALEYNEQYRMQMVGISTAAIGYWKEGDEIHPDYDTRELREVAKLYAKYDEPLKAAAQAAVPDLYEAEKLVPYEIRFFKTKRLAEKLGYKVLNTYRKIPQAAQSTQPDDKNWQLREGDPFGQAKGGEDE